MNLFKPDMTMLVGLFIGMYVIPLVVAKVHS